MTEKCPEVRKAVVQRNMLGSSWSRTIVVLFGASILILIALAVSARAQYNQSRSIFLKWRGFSSSCTAQVDSVERRFASYSVISSPGHATIIDEYGNRSDVQTLKGYADENGVVVIEPRFTWAGEFSEGRALVKEAGRSGYIDESGAWILEPGRIYSGSKFLGGRAQVFTMTDEPRKQFGFIDRDGTIIVEPTLDHASDYCNGYALAGTEPWLSKLVASTVGFDGMLISRWYSFQTIDVDGTAVDSPWK